MFTFLRASGRDRLTDMDQKQRQDETWTKRFSSRLLENTHIERLHSSPAFEVPSQVDVRLQTLLEELARAEARHSDQ